MYMRIKARLDLAVYVCFAAAPILSPSPCAATGGQSNMHHLQARMLVTGPRTEGAYIGEVIGEGEATSLSGAPMQWQLLTCDHFMRIVAIEPISAEPGL